MTNKKSAKKALLTSALSLLLCLSMLVGTTFAWFTDSVSTTNNVITAGNLDVNLYWGTEVDADGNVTDWQPVDANTNVFKTGTLWEPGHTEVVYLKVVNEGTLALQYSLDVNVASEVAGTNVAGGSFKLSNFIRYNVFNGVKSYADSAEARGDESGNKLNAPYNKAAQLLNQGEETVLTMDVFMPTTVGNEANYKTGTTAPVINMGISLFATQYIKEEDSFGNKYDEYAGKLVVTPENAQEAIWAAEEGDILYLESGVYDNLVLENADGSPKKGITIEKKKPGNNPTSDPFSVGYINLNSSEDITIKGIYFDITKAGEVFKKDGKSAGYVASIIGAQSGAATGAKNIVIDNCKFAGTSAAASNYVAICFEEQGRPTSRATNITVKNCMLDKQAFNFVRANYLSEGTVIIEGNSLPGGAAHSALNFTGNAADLIVRDNTFGFDWLSQYMPDTNGWNPEKAMLGTSRQGNNHIMIEVTGNTFINELTGEGVVIDLKSSYTADNCTVTFAGNTFKGGLEGMTEADVPCNMP